MTPPDSTQVTQRELLRYLKESIDATRELRQAVDSLRAEIAQTYVRKDVYLEARKADEDAGLAVTKRVASLENQRDWIAKLIVGAVILALLGLVVYTNGGGVPT